MGEVTIYFDDEIANRVNPINPDIPIRPDRVSLTSSYDSSSRGRLSASTWVDHNSHGSNISSIRLWSSRTSSPSQCVICLDEIQDENPEVYFFHCSNCGLRKCYECCHGWLKSIIRKNDVDELPTCIACHTQIAEEDVAFFLGKFWFKKYLYFNSRRQLANDEHALWCPREGCWKLLSYFDRPLPAEVPQVTCGHCGTQVCVTCGADKSENSRCACSVKLPHGVRNEVWKIFQTKACPNCQTSIERNGGCYRMRCTVCETIFCWCCRMILSFHGNPGPHLCDGARLKRRTAKFLQLSGAVGLVPIVLATSPIWVPFAVLHYASKSPDEQKMITTWISLATKYRIERFRLPGRYR